MPFFLPASASTWGLVSKFDRRPNSCFSKVPAAALPVFLLILIGWPASAAAEQPPTSETRPSIETETETKTETLIEPPDQPSDQPSIEPPDESTLAAASPSPELIEQLQRAISNTQWTGSFTRTGSDAAPKKESYEIIDATHQSGDQWLLRARIAYGDRDVTVPIPLEIKWAGRTPVITVDNLTIPPLGTFDARVLIRKGSYAGTWAHGEKGGHLFGKYEKMNPVDDADNASDAGGDSDATD